MFGTLHPITLQSCNLEPSSTQMVGRRTLKFGYSQLELDVGFTNEIQHPFVVTAFVAALAVLLVLLLANKKYFPPSGSRVIMRNFVGHSVCSESLPSQPSTVCARALLHVLGRFRQRLCVGLLRHHHLRKHLVHSHEKLCARRHFRRRADKCFRNRRSASMPMQKTCLIVFLDHETRE